MPARASQRRRRRVDACRSSYRHVEAAARGVCHRRRRRLVADAGPARCRLHRADLQRALGRYRHQGPREWDAHDRLRFHCNPARPTVDCPTPLGHHRWEYPARASEDEQELLTDDAIWKVLNDQGITEENVKISAGSDLQPPCTRRRPLAARPGLPGRRCRACDAAVDRPGHVGRCTRRRQPVLEARRRVERASLPESLLDTYQAERKPHVTEVTRRACRTGRIITERHRAIAVVRNHLLRNILRVPAVSARLDKFTWIPDARYRAGLLAPP